MCGRPAVPRTSARPRLRKSSLVVPVRPYFRPGCRNASPLPVWSAAAPSSSEMLKSNFGQHEHGDQDRAAHQQDRLDDLDPRRPAHAADGHVEDHQQADAHDRDGLASLGGDPEEQRDQGARAHHLGQQVEDRDDDGRGRGRRTHRALAHPIGQLVGHRVAARVAQQLGDQQQGDQPGDQEADRVQEAVVAVERDGARDAQERGRRHVVAGDRHAVLEPAERAASGVEVRGAGALSAGPEGDGDGHEDDRDEQHRGEGLGAHRWPSSRNRFSSSRAMGSTSRSM